MVILVDTKYYYRCTCQIGNHMLMIAKRIMEKCAAREITGILAAHSIPNLFYILRKISVRKKEDFF